jgi:hypothetical protein
MKFPVITLLLALAVSLVTACGDNAKATSYPLTTCLVSGEKLGSMGKPIVLIHEGQEVQFCCKSCKPKFEKDPAKYMALLKPEAASGATKP